MAKKSVRGILVALFVLANLVLVATPANAGRSTEECITESGELTQCCVWCWLFCDACELLDDDPDNENEELN
jgi:hypothetical protein